jgi:sulfoxide reductase heme-binding subunit YedZ
MKIKNEWLRFVLQNMIIGIVSYLLYCLFFWSKEGLPYGHQVNRAWADVSILLLCFSLIIGPLVRIRTFFKFLIPWRRDIGLWFAITSLIHIGLLLNIQLGWNPLKFFINDEGELLKATAHAGNWVGLFALLGTLFLTITSNRISERILGSSGWKFLQQSVYSVFWLSLLHTFIFIYMVDSRMSFFYLWFFWISILLALTLQTFGFFISIKSNKNRNR